MAKDIPSLNELISHRPLGRPLTEDEIADEFMRIRDAYEREKNKLPTPADFAAVGRGSGTHLLKLITPRAPVDASVLRFQEAGDNRIPALVDCII